MSLQRGEILGYDFNRMVVDFTMLNQGTGIGPVGVRCPRTASVKARSAFALPCVHKTDFAGSSNVVIAIEARAVNKKGPGA